jgi:hypothetical protein
MSMNRTLIAIALCASSVSCVSYSSIQKTDKEIYLSGGTNYFVIQVPFLKRCDAEGQVLHCEELKEFEAGRKSGGGGAAAEQPKPEAPKK